MADRSGAPPRQAKAFYAAIALATVLGTSIVFVALDAVKVLFWSAVLNGIVAVPVMVVMMRIAVLPRAMGRFVLPRSLRVMGWLATAAMAVTVATLFATSFG